MHLLKNTVVFQVLALGRNIDQTLEFLAAQFRKSYVNLVVLAVNRFLALKICETFKKIQEKFRISNLAIQ